MSIYLSGTFTRSGGLISAIIKQLNQLNIKPVKKIEVSFDPFHSNATEVRKLLFHLTIPKVVKTNPKCILKTTVLTDRSEPEILITLEDKRSIRLLSGNLTTLELLTLLNKHVSSLVPVEEPEVPIGKTKKRR